MQGPNVSVWGVLSGFSLCSSVAVSIIIIVIMITAVDLNKEKGMLNKQKD